MSFATELQDVCGRLDRREISREAFVAACTRLTTLHVGCARAGIWTLPEAVGGPVLHCLGIYDGMADRMLRVDDLTSDLDGLVRVLQREGHVMADDALTHPATAGWWGTTPSMHGLRSLMASSFSVNGKLAGVFTCSQVDPCLHWTAGQLALLKRVAVRASLSLASATSFTLATLPAPLMELPPLSPADPSD